MDTSGLHAAAERNRKTFERVLAEHVRLKLESTLERRGERSGRGWFDASGCVWCLFDDEGFVRSGSIGRAARDALGSAFDLQVFWSIEDVVMPAGCDERWVAGRIAREAMRQLEGRGLRCELEERMTDEGPHLGVSFCRPRGLRRTHGFGRIWPKGT